MIEFQTMGLIEGPLKPIGPEDEEQISEKIVDYNGYSREKCEELKEIRRKLVADNNLDMEIAECTSKAPCNRPCKACVAEMKEIEERLDKKYSRKSTCEE